MIHYTTGNLLEADVEALVNTVNTVGVMGKGIALMFKDTFPENYSEYGKACQEHQVELGRMFVTRRDALFGPKWIINFPTKAHWRFPSKIKWIEEGLDNLKLVIRENGIRSIALPPLGAGNGGLDWKEVRALIDEKLTELSNVDIIVYEPIKKYQNVAKRTGVMKLTPARALVAELVRRYSILGIECTLLETQKLAYFLERFVRKFNLEPFNFEFAANKYGPYSDKLKHMLDGLDGSYLVSSKRLGDARPFDSIHFKDARRDRLSAYLTTAEAKSYKHALEATSNLIDGFESPLGMELLSTIDWLLNNDAVPADIDEIKVRLQGWPGGKSAGERKLRLFEDRIIGIALDALKESGLATSSKLQ